MPFGAPLIFNAMLQLFQTQFAHVQQGLFEQLVQPALFAAATAAVSFAAASVEEPAFPRSESITSCAFWTPAESSRPVISPTPSQWLWPASR